jgi:hypothetical protein
MTRYEIDKSLNEATTDKIRKYRDDYNIATDKIRKYRDDYNYIVVISILSYLVSDSLIERFVYIL